MTDDTDRATTRDASRPEAAGRPSRRHVITLDVPHRKADRDYSTLTPREDVIQGDHTWRVHVVIDPRCEFLGQVQQQYGGQVIVLREWNPQVLLHELLHVILGGLLPVTEADPYNHEVITQIEVGLMPNLPLLASGVGPESGVVVNEYDSILTRQGQLLTGVVNALKGEPPPSVSWSHHDAPDLARAAVARAEQAEARLQSVREYAHSLGASTATRRQILDAIERGPWVQP